jgi:predicted acylesterase/phospholipase RssA
MHKEYPPLNYLAISGGANKGAFGAGFLAGWTARGNRPDFEMVTGVSTGALIAPFVFIGSKYDSRLQELYTMTNSSGIFHSSSFEVLKALTGGLSIAESGPLAEKIEKNFTPDIIAEIAAEHRKGRRLYIGTTNVEAQRGVIWDIGAIANSGNPDAARLIHQIILASASVPGLFPPVFIDVEAGGKRYSEMHADGGVVSQVFAYPMKISREVVDAFLRYHLERHLYILRNNKDAAEYQLTPQDFYDLTNRSIETLTKYQGIGDLYRLYLTSKRDEIDYNLVFIPDSFAGKSKEMFDRDYMKSLFDLGYSIGSQQQSPWLKKPPGLDYEPGNN